MATAPSPLPAFNPARLRSYILRLPLFTRICLFVILVFWLVELQTVWSVTQWGAIIPNEMGLATSKETSRVTVLLAAGRRLEETSNLMIEIFANRLMVLSVSA